MHITDEMLYEHAAEARDIWLGILPGESEIPECECSSAFERKMKRLLREQRRSPRTNRALSRVRRAAAVALVLLTVSFAGLMTVEAYRERVITFIVEVFHELTRYRFVSEAEETQMPETVFGYIPDGMERIDVFEFEGYRYTLYENAAGDFFELTETLVLPGDAYTKKVDSEDADVLTFYVGDNEVTAYIKGNDCSMIWSNHNVVYELYGTIDFAELKAVVEQIKIK